MPEQKSNTHLIVIVALLVLAPIVVGILWYARSADPAGSTATSSGEYVTEHGVTASGGDLTVTEEPTAPQAPDYTVPLSFPVEMDAEVRAVLQNQFDLTLDALKKDSTSFGAWINLGTLHKTVGDYQRAATIWKYTAQIFPKSTVPTDNLGNLYLDFIKDYAKAESYYKTSIQNDPKGINAYEQLVSLYTVYGYKDKAAALALIEQGLKVNPGNQTLLTLKTQVEAQ